MDEGQGQFCILEAVDAQLPPAVRASLPLGRNFCKMKVLLGHTPQKRLAHRVELVLIQTKIIEHPKVHIQHHPAAH